MSIATEITRLQGAKADLKTAIENKGVTVSSSALLDAYPALVASIPTGGGAVVEKLLNFYDYDGTLVASYDASEVAGLTDLPDGPDHSTDEVPLTFDEWNWTLAEVKAYYTANPNSVIIVGANYHTTDGKTHVFFTIEDANYGDCFFYSTGQGTVDWGDETTDSFSSGNVTHTYSQTGTYHCVIDSSNPNNNLAFGKSSPTRESFNVTKAFFQSGSTGYNNIFYGCSYLQSVSMPSGMTFFSRQYCFNGCFDLKCIVFPRQTTISGNLMLYNCYADVISYPGNATGITVVAPNISNLTIPSGVTTLDSNLFNGNNRIKTLHFPNTVTSIDGNTFLDCKLIQNVTLPNSITSIEGSFFKNCIALRAITIPSTVTIIKSSAFNGCSNLETVNLSSTGIITIEGSSFYGCSKLKYFSIPTTVATIGQSVFYGCSTLTSITIPYGVTTIDSNTFYNCSALASVSIPETVTTINGSAFRYNTSLTSVTLPSSLTTMNTNAFNSCSSLTTITSLATSPPAIAGTSLPNSLTKIYVPYSSDHSVLDAYKIASNWSNFASIMEELPE